VDTAGRLFRQESKVDYEDTDQYDQNSPYGMLLSNLHAVLLMPNTPYDNIAISLISLYYH